MAGEFVHGRVKGHFFIVMVLDGAILDTVQT